MNKIQRKRSAPQPIRVNRVDAVLTADLHIRADSPVCRIDDFQAAMWRKLEFIISLCKKHECLLLIGGDIGHRSQWPNWLLERFISMVKGVEIVSCLGQHDLPGHNLDELPASGCGVLSSSGIVKFQDTFCKKIQIDVYHWQEEISSDNPLTDVAISHQMVISGSQDWPDQQASQAVDLLKNNPQYKLILTGDNHIPFVERHQGRILVNPGSMMRTTAAQADHKPRVYLWDSKANEVEAVFLPIEEGVVDRSHIDEKEERDERMSALVERVKIDYQTGFSFEENMKAHIYTNPTNKETEQKIWRAME